MEDYYIANQVITDYKWWKSYCNAVADYFGEPIDIHQLTPPSYPCIAIAYTISDNGADYVTEHGKEYVVSVDFIEVCDVEPGLEYNEELAGHVLAPQLFKTATHMYM